MDVSSFVGQEVDAINPGWLVDVRIDEIVAEEVAALGRNDCRLVRGDDDVGGSESPTGNHGWRSRSLGGVTLRGSVLCPFCNEIFLFFGQRLNILKLAVTGFRLPRGHDTQLGDASDGRGAVTDVLVANEREWRDLAITVATEATLVDDRCDIL